MGVFLYLHKGIAFDCAELRYPAQIIAAQVHQHQMLCPFLFIFQQLLGQCPVLSLVRSPRPGSGNRPRSHPAAVYLHQRLRRGADDDLLIHL
ncbi:hypothetical protein D3C80_1662000 [compost metagenome]